MPGLHVESSGSSLDGQDKGKGWIDQEKDEMNGMNGMNGDTSNKNMNGDMNGLGLGGGGNKSSQEEVVGDEEHKEEGRREEEEREREQEEEEEDTITIRKDSSSSSLSSSSRQGRQVIQGLQGHLNGHTSTLTPTLAPTTDPFPDLESTTLTTSTTSTTTPKSKSVSKSSSIDSIRKPRTQSNVTARRDSSHDGVRKLSATQMQVLTSAPESLPIAIVPPTQQQPHRRPTGAGAGAGAGVGSVIDYPMSASVVETSTSSLSAYSPVTTTTERLEKNGSQTLPLPRHRPQKSGITETAGEQDLARTTGAHLKRPTSIRTLSTPPANRRAHASGPTITRTDSARRNSFNPLARPPPLNLNMANSVSSRPSSKASTAPKAENPVERPEPAVSTSAIVPPIPIPPMSLPTHLQLELAGQRPSPLYIYQSSSADVYESSAVKFERLLNALLLPPHLEKMLIFGTLACLDAWLYTFTILPMRFCIALGVLVKWWGQVIWKETRWLLGFVWEGIWRLKRRAQKGKWSGARDDASNCASEPERSRSRPRESSTAGRERSRTNQSGHTDVTASPSFLEAPRPKSNGVLHPPKHPMPRFTRHRRTKSSPSNLTSYHKADLLQGAIIICSSLALINLDASRMYHFIRAQSSMKLYVIYNILEVSDRLLSAIGQDVIECLFSSETLSRNSSGRSKLLLPFGMFVLSLAYNVLHVLCLFYQVITLNVAVNSYSNSLLTLLISNQFVEIKGAVFKRIEKENLFQLTCADVVERFQLWIILLIIAMRNIVEVGGLSVPGAGSEMDQGASGPGPLHTNSILPASFAVWPSWLLSGEVLSPFFVVIGIEMMVDWIKHAYINKFNNVRPAIYDKMLDILSKDYYTNAFGTPSLTRRIGLPLIPLSCLFIRASLQVYHMLLSTHLPPPMPTSTTELSVESSTPSSPAMTAALERLDTIIRNALGRSVHGDPSGAAPRPASSSWWGNFTSDDVIALLTMILFFFLAWIVLLIIKLVLGMALLRYARWRYAAMVMKEQQQTAAASSHRDDVSTNPTTATPNDNKNNNSNNNTNGGSGVFNNFSQPGKRVGPFGATEVGDDRRRWLYEDDPEGLRRMRERERKTEEKFKDARADDGLARVHRYEMGVSKRIW